MHFINSCLLRHNAPSDIWILKNVWKFIKFLVLKMLDFKNALKIDPKDQNNPLFIIPIHVWTWMRVFIARYGQI